MDKAVLGSCRLGFFRLGVRIDYWAQFQNGLEKKLNPRTMGGITPAVQGTARQGQTRQRVYLPFFDELVQELEKHG